MTRYDKGISGEERAERYLAGLGYVPVARRVRAPGGEIDLVMRDGETLVFVEVKARPESPRGSGLAAVTPGKRRHILRAAEGYLVSREETGSPVRFDVVEISRDGLLHIPNAFGAEGR